MVACVWAGALLLSGLIALRLRAIGPEPQRPPESEPPEPDAESGERAAEEREDLLKPLFPPAKDGGSE